MFILGCEHKQYICYALNEWCLIYISAKERDVVCYFGSLIYLFLFHVLVTELNQCQCIILQMRVRWCVMLVVCSIFKVNVGVCVCEDTLACLYVFIDTFLRSNFVPAQFVPVSFFLWKMCV